MTLNSKRYKVLTKLTESSIKSVNPSKFSDKSFLDNLYSKRVSISPVTIEPQDAKLFSFDDDYIPHPTKGYSVGDMIYIFNADGNTEIRTPDRNSTFNVEISIVGKKSTDTEMKSIANWLARKSDKVSSKILNAVRKCISTGSVSNSGNVIVYLSGDKDD